MESENRPPLRKQTAAARQWRRQNEADSLCRDLVARVKTSNTTVADARNLQYLLDIVRTDAPDILVKLATITHP